MRSLLPENYEPFKFDFFPIELTNQSRFARLCEEFNKNYKRIPKEQALAAQAWNLYLMTFDYYRYSPSDAIEALARINRVLEKPDDMDNLEQLSRLMNILGQIDEKNLEADRSTQLKRVELANNIAIFIAAILITIWAIVAFLDPFPFLLIPLIAPPAFEFSFWGYFDRNNAKNLLDNVGKQVKLAKSLAESATTTFGFFKPEESKVTEVTQTNPTLTPA